MAKTFFFKNLASSVTRYHGQLSSCTISEKTNDPILRKFSDGQTDGHTDKSDFIGRCPTNIERTTTDNKIEQIKAQGNLDRKTSNISALSSRNVSNYKLLTGDDVLL